MLVVDYLNKLLNKIGADFVRYPNRDLDGRIKLFRHHKINNVLDIGANTGGFAKELRKLGYRGKIVSFEPLNSVYETLKNNCKSDTNWSCENFAIGNFDGVSEINIANNLNSSSVLEMLPTHLKSAPESKYIGKQEIQVKRLDSIFQNYCNLSDNIYLKIDTQGFEKQIIEGADNSLKSICGIQIELSLVPLYKNSILYIEMIEFLKSKNFVLSSIEPGFRDRVTGELLQFDGVFFKSL